MLLLGASVLGKPLSYQFASLCFEAFHGYIMILVQAEFPNW